MRTLLPLVFLLSTSLNAQTTFAPIGAKWTYKQGSCCGPDTNLMVIEATSDTIIQGRTFSKLQVSEGWFGCHEFVQFFSGSNDSLFYFDPDSDQSHLLFRWDAMIGESWSTPVEQSGYPDTLDWTVMDTSHVVVDGLWLRTLEVNVESRQWMLFSYGGAITERIGGSGAPFTWILGFCDGETFQGLRCYEDPDISWLNPQFPQCDLSVGLNESPAGSSFSIRPTLASVGESIQVNGSQGTILVLDAVGRVVLERTTQGLVTFDLDTPGTYIVRFTAREGGNAHQRIVVR